MKRQHIQQLSGQLSPGKIRILELFLVVTMTFTFMFSMIGSFYTLPFINPENYWVKNTLFILPFMFFPLLVFYLITKKRDFHFKGYFKSQNLHVILRIFFLYGLLSTLCFWGAGFIAGPADEIRLSDKGPLYMGRDGTGPNRNVRRELTKEDYYRRKSYQSGFVLGLGLFLSSGLLNELLIKKKKK